MQVSRCVKELKQMGILTVVPRTRADGGWTSNLYQLQQKKTLNNKVLINNNALDPITLGVTPPSGPDVTLTIPLKNYKEKGLSKLTFGKNIKEGYERLVRHGKIDSL